MANNINPDDKHDPEWGGLGVSPSEEKEWDALGFTQHEAGLWVSNTFDPVTAALCREMGLSVWVSVGLLMEFFMPSKSTCSEWRSLNLSIKEKRAWVKAGMNAEFAKICIKHHITIAAATKIMSVYLQNTKEEE